MRDDAGIGLLVGYTMLIFLRGFAGDAAIFAHPAVLAMGFKVVGVNAAGRDVGFRLTAERILRKRAVGLGMSIAGLDRVGAGDAAGAFGCIILIADLTSAAGGDLDLAFAVVAGDEIIHAADGAMMGSFVARFDDHCCAGFGAAGAVVTVDAGGAGCDLNGGFAVHKGFLAGDARFIARLAVMGAVFIIDHRFARDAAVFAAPAVFAAQFAAACDRAALFVAGDVGPAPAVISLPDAFDVFAFLVAVIAVIAVFAVYGDSIDGAAIRDHAVTCAFGGFPELCAMGWDAGFCTELAAIRSKPLVVDAAIAHSARDDRAGIAFAVLAVFAKSGLWCCTMGAVLIFAGLSAVHTTKSGFACGAEKAARAQIARFAGHGRILCDAMLLIAQGRDAGFVIPGEACAAGDIGSADAGDGAR